MHSIVFLDRATLAPDDRLRCPSFAHRWTEYERTGPPAADSKSTRLGPT